MQSTENLRHREVTERVSHHHECMAGPPRFFPCDVHGYGALLRAPELRAHL